MQQQDLNNNSQPYQQKSSLHPKRPSYDSVVQGSQQPLQLHSQLSQMSVAPNLNTSFSDNLSSKQNVPYTFGSEVSQAGNQSQFMQTDTNAINIPKTSHSFQSSASLQSNAVALIGTVPQNSTLTAYSSAYSASSCHPSFMNCTFSTIPNSPALLSKTKVPLGVIVTPHAVEEIPISDSTAIVRCRRCRTYINPYVEFVDQGSRFICNLCFLTNDIPQEFDYDVRTRQPIDRFCHKELVNPVVEFEATSEYMIRPPQAPVFLFLLDTSSSAISSGNFTVIIQSILYSLEQLRKLERTKVAFIAFDEFLRFYSFNSTSQEPKEYVISDLEEPFLPFPEDSLVVSLEKYWPSIENFLNILSKSQLQHRSPANCLGCALKSGLKLIGNYGGKIITFISSLPNTQEGSLKPRDDPLALGTAKESLLLQPASLFYKNIAIECTRLQVGIDIFLTPSVGPYLDIATLGNCATYTGGHLYYYPSFKATNAEDVAKYSSDLCSLLNSPFGLEAVLRIRASKGIQIGNYYGNFFMRSADLLSLPNVNYQHSYVVQASIDETIPQSFATFQTALLYTTSNGERRIRVSTMKIPTTDNMFLAMSSINQAALANVLSKMAIEKCISSKLEDTREWLISKCAEIVNSFKVLFCPNSPNPQLIVAENVKLLPLLILGILKSKAFKPGNTVSLDERAFHLARQRVLSVEMSNLNFVPHFFSIHKMLSGLEDENVGSPDPANPSFIQLPRLLNLSSEKIASNRDGILVLFNGYEIYMWIGSAANPAILKSLFDVESFSSLINGKIQLFVESNELSSTYSFNQRVNAIFSHLKSLSDNSKNPYVFVVREDSELATKIAFLNQLIEDRTENYLSYPQMLLQIREKLSPK